MSWVEKIIQNKNLQDIPILHVIRVVNEIQKEICNGRIGIKKWQMMS